MSIPERMKKWFVFLVLLAAAAGGYVFWHKHSGLRAAADPSDRPTMAVAQTRSISWAVNAAGEIAPAEQVSVRPEINSLIDRLPVDVGDHVRKGEILFTLYDKDLQQQRAQNLTDIEKAKIDLDKAQRDLNRARQLLADKLISQELFDDTKTTYDLARNSLDRAQKDLAVTDEHLTKTVVRAPYDCSVLTRPVSMGQAVSGASGFNSGTEVLTIADLNNMIINAQVNQADVPRLKPNETVEVTVEAVPGLCVTGIVERITPKATIKNNIKGYPVRIALKNVDPRVRPGMTANVKIPVATAEHITAVPLAAVFTEKNAETGQMERFVYVKQDECYEKRNVKVGVADYFFAEIQDGLKEGETVALEMPDDKSRLPAPGSALPVAKAKEDKRSKGEGAKAKVGG